MALEIFLVTLCAALIRLAPIYIMPGALGVDQWSWRALIDDLRVNRKFPPELPLFKLDKRQWYPPLLLILMARLPAVLIDRYSSIFAVSIDLLRLGLLLWFLGGLHGFRDAVIIGGAVYAFTPILVTYNQQINPRGLAALFLDIFVIIGIATYAATSGSAWWLLSCLLLAAILLTHKMTTQLLWFSILMVSLLTFDFSFFLLIPISVLLALVLSKGYYLCVFRAHADIVAFWYRNWRWSGANPILESPVYGKRGYETPTKFYRIGFYPALRRLFFVFGFNPWVPLSIVLFIYADLFGVALSNLEYIVFFWVAIVFLFSLITTLVPAARCLGQGYLYGYNASFPAAALIGLLAFDIQDELFYKACVFLGFVLCCFALLAFFRKAASSKTLGVNSSLERCIEHLNALPNGVVMCFPQHWHDVVAYKTGKPVLWGGHGYGFCLIEPIFPRLMLGIKDICKKHSVSYLLTYEGYCNEQFIDDLPEFSVICVDDYRIYCFK